MYMKTTLWKALLFRLSLFGEHYHAPPSQEIYFAGAGVPAPIVTATLCSVARHDG